MLLDLSSAAWSLPGAMNFIRKIGRDLREGASQVILAPSAASLEGFRRQFLDCLERDFSLRALPLDARSVNGLTPLDCLKEHFPCLNESKYLEKAVEAADLPDVIVVENIDHKDIGAVGAWIGIAARWAEACRSSGAKHSLALLLQSIDPGRLQLPPGDLRFHYRVLAGIPSSLEMRLLCRLQANDTDAENQWREFILASLAGNDPALIELLWDEVLKPVDSIIQVLKAYAQKTVWDDWKEYHPKNWRPKPPGYTLSLMPAEMSFSLLSSGFSIFTCEYGEEVHPCILAAADNEQEIIHRLWRAQAALLLPSVDEIRRKICNYLSIKHVTDSGVPYTEFVASAMELGDLNRYIRALPDSAWEKKQWGFGISHTYYVRNQLAHYRLITYREFYEFWRFGTSLHSLSINHD